VATVTAPFHGWKTARYNWLMLWMRRRGHRVTITSGKYAGYCGTVEANVFQKTVDFPDEWSNGYHVMLDSEEIVTVRWDQVESMRELYKLGW